MLRLLIPNNSSRERYYIADVIFRHFLGLDIEICHGQGKEVKIENGDKKRLILDDSFFCDIDDTLVRRDKIPKVPCDQCRVDESLFDVMPAEQNLPVLFGKPHYDGSFIVAANDYIHLGIDILGSAFFMLTRYEELVSTKRDRFDRFPATASVSYRGGFLLRALVNEYVDLLWKCLNRLWKGLTRRSRGFRILLSHDVDQPFLLRNNGIAGVVRRMVGDVVRRGKPLQAFRRPAQWAKARGLGPEHDPAYTFDYIMDLAEKYGLRSAFYFIPSLSAGPPDYRYGILDPDIQGLLSRIHVRGHEVGYHASIGTYRDGNLIQQELELLRDACHSAGVCQSIAGSRQHYLRIDTPVTLRHLASAGLTYDTTLSFADHAGFRCGTCWEYPFYDLQNRAPLAIIVRPLIVMEGSVIDNEYMGLGNGERALDFMLMLADVCKRASGDFTLLWHNTRLVTSNERHLFEQLLARLSN